MSVLCQKRKWRIQVTQRNATQRQLHNSEPACCAPAITVARFESFVTDVLSKLTYFSGATDPAPIAMSALASIVASVERLIRGPSHRAAQCLAWQVLTHNRLWPASWLVASAIKI
jgi:hypothetical protein